jgi:hypothetical protein
MASKKRRVSPQEDQAKDKLSTKSKATRLSLYPLSFDEAVTDILKVKPEPKKHMASRKK